MNRYGKRCVLYPRVSTEMQVDGYSLEGQKNMLTRFADREEMIVVDTYEDAGKSGKSIEGRPAFQKMLRDIEDGLDIDYILVYKLSRFGRNAADILNSLELVQSYGVNLICIEEGIDSSQTSGKLLISVLSAVAEIERENIIEQTMNGRREKARQGGWNGGFAPYGYTLEDNKLMIEETEAVAIRKIFELYTSSEIGLGGIANQLNLQGIRKIPRQNGTLEDWTGHFIKLILDNPVYCGKIAYGRRTKEKVKGTKNDYQMKRNDDYILTEGQHKGIVSEEVWEKAHAKRLRTGVKQPSKIGRDRVHLLSGLLKCPVCGSPMYTNKHAWTNKDGTYKEIYYYVCSRNRMVRGKHCEYKAMLKKTDIEPMVIEAIREIVRNEEYAQAIKKRIGVQIDTKSVDKELEGYQAKLKEVDLNKTRLEREIDSLPADAKYRERKLHDMTLRLDSLYDVIVELEEKIEDARLRRDAIKQQAITLENIYKIMVNFDCVYNIINDEEKRNVVTALIKEIEIYRNDESEYPLKRIGLNFPVFKDGGEVTELLWDKGNTVETVNLPDSLTTIGDIAFFGCTKLKTLKLPKNLQTFTDSPGRNFGGLNIALTVDPENQYFSTDDLGVLYNKDKTLLYYCPNLPYTFDYTVRCDLNKYAFKGCENLRNVDIAYNLRAIPTYAFNGCKNLNTVTLPATLQRVDGAAFDSSLNTVNYRGTEELWKLITIDSYDNSAIKSANVVYNYSEEEEPEEITFTFDRSKSTVTITGSGTLTVNDIKKWDTSEINTYALKVKIGKNINVTDARVFCDSIQPFYYMKSFEVDSGNPYLSSLNGILYNKDKTKLIRFPAQNTTADYDVVECTVASTVKEIAPYAFANTGVTDVNLPSGLETIGDYAFYSATKLVDITIPGSVKTIGVGAFRDCWKMTKATLPEGLETIPRECFIGCRKLESVNIPDSVTTIGNMAFTGCALKEINISKNLTEISIPGYTFSGCPAAITVDAANPNYSADERGVLYNKDKSLLLHCPNFEKAFTFDINCNIDQYAFYNCANLTDVTFSYAIKKIPYAAFRNCGSLKITTVPDTVRMIDQVAFDGCGMTEFYLPDSVEYVGTQAFSSTPLTHFEFNDKVDTFKNIFSICPKLRTVVVGKGIKKIEIGALGGTNRIDTIYYRGTKSDWDKINVVDVASALKNIKIVYNYGQTSGVCGDNLTWSLQPDLFQITVEGSGDMYSYDNAEDFTWSSNADLVTGVVFGNGVTSVGKNAFNSFPHLNEVLLGSDVKNINSLAFANCGDLMTVAITTEGDTEIEYDAFDGHNEKFLLICDEKNTAAQAFALDNEMPLVTVSYDEEKKVINFKGTLTVFDGVAGRYLAYYASRYPDAIYLHFDVLTFDGIKTADSTDGKRFECVDPDSEYLTFKDIYVKISVMKDGEEKDVTFGEMLERYENGDYDAFYAEIENDNGTDKSLVVKAFQAIFKPILKITSSIINFIKKLFK